MISFAKQKMKFIFQGESKSSKRVAERLMDSARIVFDSLVTENDSKSKMTGFTTNG